MIDLELINRLMNERGFSPAELAREAKLSHTTIYRVLNNESDSNTTIGTIEAIAKVFKVSAASLLGEGELKPRPASYMISVPRELMDKGEIEVTIKFI